MKLITLILMLCFSTVMFSQDKINNTSTYYFIRHAEKDKTVKHKDPKLIDKGKQRAIQWSAVFKHVDLDAIYSTDYIRTRETALPTANSKNKEITIYNPKTIDINTFLKTTSGKNILIVGHSNTMPMFVNKILGFKKYEQIDESNNANLYIVTITASGDKLSQLLVID